LTRPVGIEAYAHSSKLSYSKKNEIRTEPMKLMKEPL